MTTSNNTTVLHLHTSTVTYQTTFVFDSTIFLIINFPAISSLTSFSSSRSYLNRWLVVHARRGGKKKKVKELLLVIIVVQQVLSSASRSDSTTSNNTKNQFTDYTTYCIHYYYKCYQYQHQHQHQHFSYF
jgi:hypothetical protein